MPHDKKGRLIEVGDVVKGKGYDNVEKAGVVTQVTPGSTTCNVTIGIAVQKVQVEQHTFTASDLELVAKADGSIPASA